MLDYNNLIKGTTKEVYETEFMSHLPDMTSEELEKAIHDEELRLEEEYKSNLMRL